MQENAMLHQAAKWYEEGDYEKVKDALQEAGSKQDASSDTLKLLAYSEFQLGEFENAEKRSEAVVEKDPSDHASLYNLARLYAQKASSPKPNSLLKERWQKSLMKSCIKRFGTNLRKKPPGNQV